MYGTAYSCKGNAQRFTINFAESVGIRVPKKQIIVASHLKNKNNKNFKRTAFLALRSACQYLLKTPYTDLLLGFF